MNKKYSDVELLSSLQNWQKSVSEKIKKESLKYSIKDVELIKTILKQIKKEVKKQSKNSNTDWNVIWCKVVGEEIAKNTKVKRWNNGFLEIIVSNPILRSELDAFFKESLLESLRESIADQKIIRGIKFISS